MPPHFFLSYAPADSGPLVKKFFDDLCDIIRITLRFPRNRVVGFYEELGHQPGVDWSPRSAEALKTSRSMVCLLSPAYFHSERAGQEWKLFEMRMHEAFAKAELEYAAPTSLAQIIFPVSWIPLEGPIPTVINELLMHPDRIYQKQAVTMMFKQSKSLAEYASFVKTLAYKIIEMTDAVSFPPLDSLPPRNHVHNSFQMWDESTIDSNVNGSRGQDDKHKFVVIDEEFLGSLAVRMNERGRGGIPPLSDSVSEPAARDKSHEPKISPTTQQLPFSVSILADDFERRKMLYETLKTHDFEVTLYESAEDLDLKIDREYSYLRGPDLFVIDLPHDSKENLEVIRKLTVKNIPSSKIALWSRPFDVEAPVTLGAVMFEKTDPFELELLIEMMKNAANFGRDRRSRRGETKPEADSRRYSRPVFLSYRHAHRELAIGLTAQIEARGIPVWFADDLRPGDKWNELAKESIDDVRIFLPLITEDYAESNHCRGEIARFRARLKVESSEPKPVLLPLVRGLTDSMKRHKDIAKIIEGKPIDLSPSQFVSGLNILLARIEAILENGRGV